LGGALPQAPSLSVTNIVQLIGQCTPETVPIRLRNQLAKPY
jgi:hypothetical protein